MHVGLRVRVCVVSGTTQQTGARLEAGYLNPRQPIEPATFALLAEYANQHVDDRERQPLIFAIVDAISPHLDTGTTAHWWNELLHCLDRAEASATSGPAWDEVGVDWDARATEAAQMLAGLR